MKTVLLVLALVGCTPPGSGQPPAPSTSAPPPPSPSPSASTAQDPSTCHDACTRAQTACRKNQPKPQSYCEGKCAAAAVSVVSPSLDCLAVNFTCNEDCPQP